MAKKIIYKIHEIKKELILQEASLIFEKSGYDSMKISDLAKNVGVSQSTIYSMFENKEGLYIEYIKLQIKNFLEELTKITISSTPYEKLNEFIVLKFKNFMQKEKAIESNIKNNPLFFNTFYHDITNPLEEVYKFLTDTFLEYDPNISHDKAVKLAYLFNSLSDGYITLWLENDIDLANISNEVCTSFLSILKSVE